MEWNAFVKPIIYVLELVFGAVVTFGTADKLLYLETNASGNRTLRCAMGGSIAACASVITIGAISLVIGLLILRKRLIAAFDDSTRFANATEALVCFMVSVLWLVIAAVVTAKLDPTTPPLRGEKIVTITFSWLLWILYSCSSAIAWFVPEVDTDMLHAPSEIAAFGDDRRLRKDSSDSSEVLDMAESTDFKQGHVDDGDDLGGGNIMDNDQERQRPLSTGLVEDDVLTAPASSQTHASLVRSNARRNTLTTSRRDMTGKQKAGEVDVDTSLINERLTEWETLVDGVGDETPLAAVSLASIEQSESAQNSPAVATTSTRDAPHRTEVRRRNVTFLTD